MRFWLPPACAKPERLRFGVGRFVCAPQRLVPGSCVAERLAARVRFGGGDRLTLSPEECAARQLAYRRQREAWRLYREAEQRHEAETPPEGHTGALRFE